MSRKSGWDVELHGPFFTKDPRKTFRQNARALLTRVAEEGEKAVDARAGVGPGPVHIQDYLVGRVVSLRGKPWALTAIVSNLLARRVGRRQDYGKELNRRNRFFWRGIQTIRKPYREARELLKGLE